MDIRSASSGDQNCLFCRFPLDAVFASVTQIGHIFRFSIFYTTGAVGVPDSGSEPREFCLFSPYRRQHGWTCNSWPHKRQHGWTCNFRSWPGVARFVNLAYLARQLLFSLVQPRNVAGCLHLRRLRRTESTVCRVIYVVLVPVRHSHSKRHEASSRARRWSWRHATRRGFCLPSRGSRSRLLKWLW